MASRTTCAISGRLGCAGEIVDYVAKGGNDLSPLVREAVAIIATESVVESEEVGEG